MPTNKDTNELLLYAIQSKDGKWFRRKGYGGGGDSWVAEFSKARIFTAIGGARGVVSWWAKNFPTYGTPNLVILHIGEVEKVDETKRLTELNAKRERLLAKKEVAKKQRMIDDAKSSTKSAERALELARQRLAALESK